VAVGRGITHEIPRRIYKGIHGTNQSVGSYKASQLKRHLMTQLLPSLATNQSASYLS